MSSPEPTLSQSTLEADKQLIGILLAQFDACRSEIQARSSNQAAILNLNITATGVIAGYYFASNASPLVLLMIPLLSPMLGIIWSDHAINIGYLGRFIQHSIMPLLRATLKRDLPDYEMWIRNFERDRGKRLLLLISPMLLLFAILPASSLVLAWTVSLDRDALFYVLAATGAVLILIFGGYSMSLLFGWIWTKDWPGPDDTSQSQP